MTKKKTNLQTQTVSKPGKEVSAPSQKPNAEADKNAVLMLSPEFSASRVISSANSNIESFANKIPMLLKQLRSETEAVHRGDLSQAEAMLMSQSMALQALFVRLAERSMDQTQMPNLEAFMRIALRAQSQCRATLETLAAIKNPPVIYAKQANVTSGPQQINNGMAAPSQAQEKEIKQSKLLEAHHGQWLDSGTAKATIGTDSRVATVGEIDGAYV